MRGSRLTAFAAGALMLLGGGVAMAHNRTHPTTIAYEGHSFIAGSDTLFFGHLESPRHRCLSNRKVKAFAHYTDGSRQLVDTDRSSENGFWEVRLDVLGVDAFEAKVTRKRFGRRHHRHICKADSILAPLA